MSGLFSLDKWDSEAQYLVLDDIDWEYLPYKKHLLGAQREFTATDRYKPKRTLLWGKPCIYCINRDQYLVMVHGTTKQPTIMDWLEDNCIFVHIENKLY